MFSIYKVNENFYIFLHSLYEYNKKVKLLESEKNGYFQRIQQRSILTDYSYTIEDVLALILKENIKNSECEAKLKEYCNNITTITSNLNAVDPKLEKICEVTNKCADLKEKIIQNCKILNQTLTNASYPIEENCDMFQKQCLFLEGACPDILLNSCGTLRDTCYKKARMDVAEELLTKALSGNLIEETTCEFAIKEKCIVLSSISDEMMLKCLNSKTTCKKLVQKAKKTCTTIREQISLILNNDNGLKEKCIILLEQCHFYNSNCDENNKFNCIALKAKCGILKITYRPPTIFDPIKANASLLEKIGMENLYAEMEKVGPKKEKDITDFLGLMIVVMKPSGKFEVDKCKDLLRTHCTSFSYINKELEDLCQTYQAKNKAQACEELQARLVIKSSPLQTKLKEKHLVKTVQTGTGYYNSISAIAINWYRLPMINLTKDECTELQSECFYLEQSFRTDLKRPCQNLRAVCYKKWLDAQAKSILESLLKGSFCELSSCKTKSKCDLTLINKCAELKNQQGEFLEFCLYPGKTCGILKDDIKNKSQELKHVLDKTRDKPSEKDCEKLEQLCKDLVHDFYYLINPCAMFHQNCLKLKATKILKYSILDEKKSILKNHNNCTQYLGYMCIRWLETGNKIFTLPCSQQNDTCNLILEETKDHCAHLSNHMKQLNIVNNIGNNTEGEELCDYWGSYCDIFAPNCPSVLWIENNQNETKNGICKKLQEKCVELRKNLDYQNILMHELKGHLTNKDDCKKQLDYYCKQSANHTNKLILSLCSGEPIYENQKGQDIKEILCSRFINWIMEKCITLPSKLIEGEKNLTKKHNHLKVANEAAKKAIQNPGPILSILFEKEKEQNGISKHKTSLISFIPHKNTPTFLPTELNVKAFRMVVLALGLYLEAKAECDRLFIDCDFENDCIELKTPCKKIREICKEIVPVEIKLYEVKENITTVIESTTVFTEIEITSTETITNTTTVTETMCETLCKDCTFILTSKIWITGTSTFTKTETYTKTTLQDSTIHTNKTTITFTKMSTLESSSLCTSEQLPTSTQSISGETDKQVIIPDGTPISLPQTSLFTIFLLLLGVIQNEEHVQEYCQELTQMGLNPANKSNVLKISALVMGRRKNLVINIRKRDKIAEEILIRLFENVLKDEKYQEQCEEFLKEICLKLGVMSKELAKKYLDPKKHENLLLK
ncbi:hypothetical protein PCK1_001017 [Pneumocystis canis]|nr:hypothetical protein PCK1_001017 [Pneumocystis canis]